jgi:NAD(P)H-dependent FMN reductase
MAFVLERATVEISAEGDVAPKLAKEKAKAAAFTKSTMASASSSIYSAVAAGSRQTLSALGLGALVGGGVVATAAGGFAIAKAFSAKANPVANERFNKATDDLQAVIGRGLTPVIDKATNGVRRFADAWASSNGIGSFLSNLYNGRGSGSSLGASGIGSQVTSANSYSQFLTNAALRGGGNTEANTPRAGTIGSAIESAGLAAATGINNALAQSRVGGRRG